MLYVSSSIRTFVVLAIALAILHQPSMANAAPSQVHTVLTPASAPSQPQIKSYREWKLSMVGDAEARVKSMKESFLKTRGSASTTTEAGLSPQLQNIQYQIDKEELQYSLAQDLTITDYFVGYLTKQKSLSAAIKQVSGRLSAEEVAELMTAYADNFFSSKPTTTIQAPRADSGL